MFTPKNDRFEQIFIQKMGIDSMIEIWIDKDTGVNYMYRRYGYSGGMTVLVDGAGKPVVSPV